MPRSGSPPASAPLTGGKTGRPTFKRPRSRGSATACDAQRRVHQRAAAPQCDPPRQVAPVRGASAPSSGITECSCRLRSFPPTQLRPPPCGRSHKAAARPTTSIACDGLHDRQNAMRSGLVTTRRIVRIPFFPQSPRHRTDTRATPERFRQFAKKRPHSEHSRAPADRRQNFQPSRYSLLTYLFADSQFENCIFSASQTSLRPTRSATLPSRIDSVNRPA